VSPEQYYTEQVPAQFNRVLAEQERAAEGDADAARVLDAMKSVDATIRVEVRGEGGGTWFLNVKGGRVTAGESPDQAPFLTLVQDRGDFEALVAEAGDSPLGLLGGLSGLSGAMKLTRLRIDNLSGMNGMLQFTLQGEGGFTLLTHFGSEPLPDEPTTKIAVQAEGYRKLRAGEIDPQQAFMDGTIQVEGDMQLAMQLALAALSPD
jgi:hypothetical protein